MIMRAKWTNITFMAMDHSGNEDVFCGSIRTSEFVTEVGVNVEKTNNEAWIAFKNGNQMMDSPTDWQWSFNYPKSAAIL